MHLKEYTYSEIVRLLKQAGFKYVFSVFRFPIGMRRRFGWRFRPRVSRFYLVFLVFLEKMVAEIRPRRLGGKVAKLSKIVLFLPGMMVVATKSHEETTGDQLYY